MQTLRDPKAMAKALRQALAERRIDLSHSDSLECVARQLGWRDWNTLAARLDRPALRLPRDWAVGGSRPDDYEIGVDEQEGCALIRAKPGLLDPLAGNQPAGFATLMQSIEAERYLGQRLRLAAQLKVQDVSGAATMWLRVDGERKDTLAFDNMEARQADGALAGTQGWQGRAIVLDVPAEARSIHFGFYLRGGGQVWARRFRLDEVDASVAVTAPKAARIPGPANLDFAEVT